MPDGDPVIDDRSRINVGSGHLIWLADDGTVASWEHPTPTGKHEVAPVSRTTWTVVSREPLTLTPSLFCDASRGGCGMHGFVTNGRYA